MIEHFDPVPFTIEVEAHFGLSEVQGILCSDGNNLVIEYRLVDTVVGMMKSDLKEIEIPLADLWTIKYERKWFGWVNRILIRTRRQQALGEIPESAQGMVVCSIKRSDRHAAEAFCLEAGQRIMQNRNLLLEDLMDREELGM
jgi:hypothetical protein